MKIKRLTNTYNVTEFTEITPKIGKDGWFLVGNECWIEEKGKAYTNEDLKNMFNHKLALLNAEEFNNNQFLALKNLVKQRLATKEQRTLLRNIETVKELRASLVELKTRFIRLKK